MNYRVLGVTDEYYSVMSGRTPRKIARSGLTPEQDKELMERYRKLNPITQSSTDLNHVGVGKGLETALHAPEVYQQPQRSIGSAPSPKPQVNAVPSNIVQSEPPQPTPPPQTPVPQAEPPKPIPQKRPGSQYDWDKLTQTTTRTTTQKGNPVDMTGYNQALERQNRALDVQNAVEAGVNAIQQTHHQKQGSILAEQQKQLAEISKRQKEEVHKATKTLEEMQAKYDSTEIKPFRKLEGIGSKIMAAIAVALGAVGQGYGSRTNTGLDMINSIIDKDIQQQRDMLTKQDSALVRQRGLIAELRQKGMDDKQEIIAAKTLKLQQAQQLLEEQMAVMKSPQQIALAEKLKADLQMQREKELMNLQKITQDKVVIETLEQPVKGLDARKVVGTEGTAKTVKQAEKANTLLSDLNVALQKIERAKELRDKHGTEWLKYIGYKSDGTKVSDSLATQIQFAIKDSEELGALVQADMDLIRGMIPETFVGVSNPTVQLDELQKHLEEKVDARLKQYGLRRIKKERVDSDKVMKASLSYGM